MKIKKISDKQLKLLTWWSEASPYREHDAIICDGAVRSGKTLFMGISFISWAMHCFDGMNFGLCGKSVSALRRNMLTAVLPVMEEMKFVCSEKIGSGKIEISFFDRKNTFYIFGGYDEKSASLIQGITFAGVLMDEAALMPRSFVEQACARCSVEGSKIWFNCNPEGPYHWFYLEWIKKAQERNALYLHFTMNDNPSLSPKIRERYERMYSGVFYRRFVLGQWAANQGLVYDFFDESFIQKVPDTEAEKYVISCDYGTANPMSMGLWGKYAEQWFRVKEYYYDSRAEHRQKTDGEYAEELDNLARGHKITGVVVDPSAASFIELLRRKGYTVKKADNDVLTGIRITSDLLKQRKIIICSECGDIIREFSLYAWDEGKQDCPIKKNDHAMDDMRYFAMSIAAKREDYFTALAVSR